MIKRIIMMDFLICEKNKMEKQTIISFVDTSKYCNIVCQYPAFLAKKSQSKIKIYHILTKDKTSAKTDLSGSIDLGAKTKLLEKLIKHEASLAKKMNFQGWEVLENAKKEILKIGNFNIEIRLRTGKITESLIEKEKDGDILVIGKRGEVKQNIQWKLGSNFENIVRSSKKPIFVANKSFKKIKNILIAFDGSPTTIKLIDFFTSQNFFSNCNFTIVQIFDSKKNVNDKYLEVLENLKNAGLNVSGQSYIGQARSKLADLVESDNYDLLAIGAYGHSKVRNLLFGSTTSELIKNNKIPFLLMR